MSTQSAIPCGAFPSTHWSLVGEAGNGSGDARRRALTALLKQYVPALRSHLVYGRRMNAHDADDLLQSFVADKVLADELVSRADRLRGRFRSFLLASLDHFASNAARRDNALKRAPRHRVPLDQAEGVAGASTTGGDSFDVAWGRQVLAAAVERMRAECAARKRPDVWGVFESRVLKPALDQADPVPYVQIVKEFGFASPSQATNALVTANRMFVRNLRAVVGAYARDEHEVDEEIADLKRILADGRAGS